MIDRNVQHPHRYQLIPVPGEEGTFDVIAKPGTITEVGTPINKATLFSDATAALYGLTGDDATVDGALRIGIPKKLDKLMINSLLTNLRFSTNSTNIDAWCDLLSDNSMLNTGASSGYTLSGGQLTPTSGTVGSAQTSQQGTFGSSYVNTKVGFVFTPTITGNVYNVKLNLKKIGLPTDNIIVKLYATSAGLPTTVIATSTTTLAGTSLTTNYVQYDFKFNATVNADTVYAIGIERSGALSSTNYYAHGQASGGSERLTYNGSSWSAASGRPDGIVYIRATATVIWNATTATEVLTRMAVVADQTLNTGTITWYVSHNGTNWTQITALSTAQNVNFTGTSVYLKCVATSDSVVKAVAWGG